VPVPVVVSVAAVIGRERYTFSVIVEVPVRASIDANRLKDQVPAGTVERPRDAAETLAWKAVVTHEVVEKAFVCSVVVIGVDDTVITSTAFVVPLAVTIGVALKNEIPDDAEEVAHAAFTQLEPFQVRTSLNIGSGTSTSERPQRAREVVGKIFAKEDDTSVKEDAHCFIIILPISEAIPASKAFCVGSRASLARDNVA